MDSSTLLFLAGVLLLLFTLVRYARRRFAAKSAEGDAPLQPVPGPRRAGSEERDVQLHATFRELNARLETKIAVLNALIEEADRKIALLERPATSGDVVGKNVESVEAGDAMASSKRAVVAEAVGMDASEPAGADGGYEDIYRMSDRGLTPDEIGQKLNQPVGEIELILGLRRHRKSG